MRIRKLSAVATLMLLSPLVGEYLLGNYAITDLAALPLMMLLYGTGAVFVRETARQLGRGYGTMLGLGVAYALIEEGLVDQMLFNPDYFDGQSAVMQTPLPWIGVDLWLLLVVTAMHAVWSILIPIVLTERALMETPDRPWFGRRGYAVSFAAFTLGCAFLTWLISTETRFMASPAQLATAAIAAAAVVAVTLAGPRHHARTTARPWPSVWLALGSFALSSMFMLTDELSGWGRVLACAAVGLLGWIWLARQCRSWRWSARHGLALVAGCLGTYAWLGALMVPEMGPKTAIDHVGSAVLILLVFALWWRAWQRAEPVPS